MHNNAQRFSAEIGSKLCIHIVRPSVDIAAGRGAAVPTHAPRGGVGRLVIDLTPQTIQ